MKSARNVLACVLGVILALAATGCIVIQTEKIHYVPRAPQQQAKPCDKAASSPTSQPAENVGGSADKD